MRDSKSLSFPPKTIGRIALSCALLFAGGAHAQTFAPQFQQQSFQQPFQFQPNVGTQYGQGAYGQTMAGGIEEQQRPSTRGIFAITIAALVAQGIGTGIASGLSQGIGGSILKWFTGATGETQPAPEQALALQGSTPTETPAASREGQGEPSVPGQLHAGLAFEIHRLGRDGSSAAVDPSRHVFRTGDRFQVHYRPTLPGRIDVFNVNPRGTESRVDAAAVAAGQLVTLGPYEFVDTQGDEVLKMVLSPCSTPALMVATRNIVRASTSQTSAERTSASIADCGDVRQRGLRKRTRDIKKVNLEGKTAFAFDPVSREEMTSGVLAARELKIRLVHR